jgi:leucyl aminopeptidase
VQLRIVTDQPWDVPADVLVVPVAAEPAFDGPLGELDRRTGGDLQRLLAFGEVRGKRYATALASAGESAGGRLLAVGFGDPAKLDRESVVRVAAAAERRLGGRTVHRLAVWLSPLADAIDGGFEAVAELVARGVVEGSYDPRTIYREDVEAVPPVLDELILIAPGANAIAVARAAERGVVMGEGANFARTLSPRRQRQPEVPRRSPAVAEQHDLWIGVIEPERGPSRDGHVRSRRAGSDLAADDLLRSGGKGRDAIDRHPRSSAKSASIRRHQHQVRRPDGRDEDGQDRRR